MQGPLGNYGIAQSLVQTPGWKALEAEENEMLPGGGGGGFGMRFGGGPQQRPYNDMERTILAHDYPGGFKVATDQYAAKYSDQLDAWAKEEMKKKFPKGAATGLTWDEEFARQKKLKDNYQTAVSQGKTPQLWGPGGPTGRTAETAPTIWKKPPPSKVSRKTLSGVADRDRSGLASVFSRAKQNRTAIASRPRSSGRTSTSAAAYSNFGRFR